LTVTVGRSPEAVPAAPENVGLVLFDALEFAGVVNVTAGGVVSIVNVFADDVPVLPASSDWDACAV
jgi:hypothetical protein